MGLSFAPDRLESARQAGRQRRKRSQSAESFGTEHSDSTGGGINIINTPTPTTGRIEFESPSRTIVTSRESYYRYGKQQQQRRNHWLQQCSSNFFFFFGGGGSCQETTRVRHIFGVIGRTERLQRFFCGFVFVIVVQGCGNHPQTTSSSSGRTSGRRKSLQARPGTSPFSANE